MINKNKLRAKNSNHFSQRHQPAGKMRKKYAKIKNKK